MVSRPMCLNANRLKSARLGFLAIDMNISAVRQSASHWRLHIAS